MVLAFKFCLMVTFILSFSFTVSAQSDTCNACNCQFNNVDALAQLIELKIATTRTNESVSGVTYTRWGKTSCPSSTGAELVYSGRARGTAWNVQGGAAEKICLPDDPEYASGLSVPYGSTVQGVEYELISGPNANVNEYNAPCAVCFVPTKAVTIMLPAKTTCPSSWTREYYGYLSAGHPDQYRSLYTCLDHNPEVIAGSNADEPLSLFHYAVTDCIGLSCPPYESGRILSCVVCTK